MAEIAELVKQEITKFEFVAAFKYANFAQKNMLLQDVSSLFTNARHLETIVFFLCSSLNQELMRNCH